MARRIRKPGEQVNLPLPSVPPTVDDETLSAANNFEKLVGFGKKGRKKSAGIRITSLQKAEEEVEQMVIGKVPWKDANPIHFVALYARCHRVIYGFDTTSLEASKDRMGAVSMAKSMLKNRFNGEAEVMFEYMSWAWRREKARDKWRRDNKMDLKHLPWRFVFGGTLMDDWRRFALQVNRG